MLVFCQQEQSDTGIGAVRLGRVIGYHLLDLIYRLRRLFDRCYIPLKKGVFELKILAVDFHDELAGFLAEFIGFAVFLRAEKEVGIFKQEFAQDIVRVEFFRD